jgi:hypothetical protein
MPRELAEAGCTAHQIAAISGHKSMRLVEHYTRAVDQAKLARNAMARIASGTPGNDRWLSASRESAPPTSRKRRVKGVEP